MERRYSTFFPRTVEARWLERASVGRESVVELLAQSFEQTLTSGAARFDVVAGGRGSGKSHVLGLITAELLRRLPSESAVIAAVDPLVQPTSLAMLLVAILESMPAEDSLPNPKRQVEALRSATDQQIERAQGFISSRLAGRALLVVLDDLDVFFEHTAKQSGAQRLRSLLQMQGTWSILTTAAALSAFTSPRAPFFGFFTAHRLTPLDRDESHLLLSRLAEVDEDHDLSAWLSTPSGHAAVRAAQIFVGRLPRAMVWLYPHLRGGPPDIVAALGSLARELEPYYVALLGQRSPMQRVLLATLAGSWAPLSVAEIAERPMASHQSTSSQLAKLRVAGLVHASRAGRKRLYEAEPLLRLAHLMMRNPKPIELRLHAATRLFAAPDTSSPAELLRELPQVAELLEPPPTHPDDPAGVDAHTALAIGRLATPDRNLLREAAERLPEAQRGRLGVHVA